MSSQSSVDAFVRDLAQTCVAHGVIGSLWIQDGWMDVERVTCEGQGSRYGAVTKNAPRAQTWVARDAHGEEVARVTVDASPAPF